LNRRSDFVNGEVLAACSICGRRRLFPSQITYCPDRLYRCVDSCMEKSAFEYDQEIAAYRRRRPEPDVSVGVLSQFDGAVTTDEDMGFP
jgi:hypothetical protein